MIIYEEYHINEEFFVKIKILLNKICFVYFVSFFLRLFPLQLINFP